MDIKITPARLSGIAAAIPSKSDAHRLLILAALADQPTTLQLPLASEDIQATCSCLEALGAGIRRDGDRVLVTPIRQVPSNPLLDCGESGSTLRFLLPVAAAIVSAARFTGRGRLAERPIAELKTALAAHGVTFSSEKLPFTVTGRLQPGDYSVPGNVSSQYITGLLLAMAAMGGGSSLTLETDLESAAYVDITLHALQRFAVEVGKTPAGWSMNGDQALRSPGKLTVDGDWSNAAFFLVAGAIGNLVTVKGLDLTSTQGDKLILEVLRTFGAGVEASEESVTVSKGPLEGCVVDLREIPDALPALAVLAACAKGETAFINAGRLRLKESDRLTAVADMIRSLGGKVQELPEGLIIQGGPLTGGTVNGYGDHRIVMAAAVAASVCREPVTITGAEAVRKSYPNFFEDYSALGGDIHVL